MHDDRFLRRIAFGSCRKQAKPQPVWDARELVGRFMQWQQPHAWKQLEGEQRLWATSQTGYSFQISESV